MGAKKRVMKLGKNVILACAVTISSVNEKIGKVFFQPSPFLSVDASEKSITVAVTDFSTFDGFYVQFNFAEIPAEKFARAWYGAAKMVGKRVALILKKAGVMTVSFSAIRGQEFTDVEKAAISEIKKFGIEIF